MKKIKIANKIISMKSKPFIIAEMSGNHNQSLERAIALVDAAANAGVDAIKLQTYTADTMTLNVDKPEFKINDAKSLWDGMHLYDLYTQAHTPWEWHRPIMEYAKERGLICFSTPFDATAVDFLESLDVPCYKIASFENTDIALIKKVASTGKPVIISTGMASLSDLELLTSTLSRCDCDEFILLKCTSAYPAPYTSCNLHTIPHMSQLFDCIVGLSDHTLGISVPIASVALGARVIEKHFILSKEDGGVDSAFSLDQNELAELVKQVNQAYESLGQVEYTTNFHEKQSLQFRRSLYFTRKLSAGHKIKNTDIRSIRPGYGLAPKYYDSVIGATLIKNVEPGDSVNWQVIKNKEIL